MMMAATLVAPMAARAESGVFDRAEPAGATAVRQRVFFHRPAAWRADGPVAMVMHGVNRDADRYRDQWAGLADRHGLLLLCPEFSREKFPGDAWYNFGGLRQTADAHARAFAVPDRVFRDAREKFGATRDGYALYGHSAGAQFVHRFLLLAPSAMVSAAVAANAGWYTQPLLDVPFPYGLADTPATEADIVKFLSRPLVLHLGERDTNRADPNLRRDAGADAQGPHRLARGAHFFALGAREALRRGIGFGWRLHTVPGVGHENGRMADAAAPELAG